MAVCAGAAPGTAELRTADGHVTATFPVIDDVHPTVSACPHRSAYLVSVGAGQDGQWSWWISDDGGVPTATEIRALRGRAVQGLAADGVTALSVPWAYGDGIAWHDLPGGTIVRRVDPAEIIGDDDDEVLETVDLGGGSLLLVTGEGHALWVDRADGRPAVTTRLPAARSPSGWSGGAGVTADELLLRDDRGGIALVHDSPA